jgi:hypothetical protein
MSARKPLTEVLESISSTALAALSESAKTEVLLACAAYANSLDGPVKLRTSAKHKLVAALKHHKVNLVQPLPTARKSVRLND